MFLTDGLVNGQKRTASDCLTGSSSVPFCLYLIQKATDMPVEAIVSDEWGLYGSGQKYGILSEIRHDTEAIGYRILLQKEKSRFPG